MQTSEERRDGRGKVGGGEDGGGRGGLQYLGSLLVGVASQYQMLDAAIATSLIDLRLQNHSSSKEQFDYQVNPCICKNAVNKRPSDVSNRPATMLHETNESTFVSEKKLPFSYPP